jgi:hypothetical protein
MFFAKSPGWLAAEDIGGVAPKAGVCKIPAAFVGFCILQLARNGGVQICESIVFWWLLKKIEIP